MWLADALQMAATTAAAGAIKYDPGPGALTDKANLYEATPMDPRPFAARGCRDVSIRCRAFGSALRRAAPGRDRGFPRTG